jgi:hypothetical protein
MGDGKISGGVRSKAPIQDINVDEAKPKEVPKNQTPTADPSKTSSPAPDSSSKKADKNWQGVVYKNQLNKQLPKSLDSESLKAADKVLENPKLSNEAKIAELQKILGKTDKLEFEYFLKHYDTFPEDQRQLINSAITESEQIMGRIGSELKPDVQLKIVQDAIMNPAKGKTPKEEEKRLARADKGVSQWMQRTDTATLDKALDGRSIDFKASAKLYAAMVADSARLVYSMGHNQGKIMPDKLEIATQLVSLATNPQRTITRDELESAAAAMIAQDVHRELDEETRDRNRRRF